MKVNFMTVIETCPMCGHDLINEIIATYPPIPRKKCSQCGWSWEGEPEQIIRVPFKEPPNIVSVADFKQTPNPCRTCSNHPSNGGSGICFCTLGMPHTYC